MKRSCARRRGVAAAYGRGSLACAEGVLREKAPGNIITWRAFLPGRAGRTRGPEIARRGSRIIHKVVPEVVRKEVEGDVQDVQ